jgi:Fe/S biogenesis protein NfuA
MITLSDTALKGLKSVLDNKCGTDCLGLRLKVIGGQPGAYQADFRFVKEGEDVSNDILLDKGEFTIYMDSESAPKLDGVRIDYVQTFKGPQFKIEFPLPEWDDPLSQRIQTLITDQINPGVASHGGYVTLHEVRDQNVYLTMGGGCQGCGMASATLRQGIERMILDTVPEVKAVVDQTDHAGGTNPYYQPNAAAGGSSPLVSG